MIEGRTLKELMEGAVHETMDNDHDNDFHMSRRIVRRYVTEDMIIIQETHVARICTGQEVLCI